MNPAAICLIALTPVLAPRGMAEPAAADRFTVTAGPLTRTLDFTPGSNDFLD